MIIGISGHKGSGKDEIGKIIQYLISINKDRPADGVWTYNNYINTSNWQIKKFADTLKDIICLLTGCTREQLEDEDFKNSKLPDEWIRYGYADGFFKYYKDGKEETKMNNVQCDKERYELEYRTNWQTAYKIHPTYRDLLQYLGTDLFRNQLHENVWVNSLMSKYKPKVCSGVTLCALAGKLEISCNECPEYPNWIITDVRFPNELEAIKKHNGLTIRINRDSVLRTGKVFDTDNHESETALDNYQGFDYVIDNNGTIEELKEVVKDILIKEHLI